MAQPPWHKAGGGGRGIRRKNAQWNNTVRRPTPTSASGGRLDVRSNVWTPATAAASAAAVAPGAAPSVRSSVAAAAAATAVGRTSIQPSSPPITRTENAPSPAVKARTSIRKAAEAVEVASKQSAAEIEGHLQQVEARLSVVKAQEVEVKAIADEHLAREASLEKLLESLRAKDQEEQNTAQRPHPVSVDGGSSAAVTTASGGGDGDRLPAMRTAAKASDQDSASHSSQPSSATKENTKAAAARRDVGQSNGRSDTGSMPTVVVGAPGSIAGAATGGADAGMGLLLAMAVGGAGDGVLTRDAATIREYILLMSDQAIGSREAEGHGGMGAERWRQPGLSLKEALDQTEASFARPPRPPNLLALAALIRTPRVAGARSKTEKAVGGGKRKGAPLAPSGPQDGASPGVIPEAVAALRTVKRRRVDPNVLMCPFELNGVCNDDDCRYQHMDVYLPSTLTANTASSAAMAGSAAAASGANTAHAVSRPDGNNSIIGSSPRLGQATASAGTGDTGEPATRPTRNGNRGVVVAPRQQQQQQQLPPIDFSERDGGNRGAPKGGRPGAKRPRPPTEDGGVSAVRSVDVAGNDGIGVDGDNLGRGGGGGGGEGYGRSAVGDDFLALSTGNVAASGGSGSGFVKGGFDISRALAGEAAAATLAEEASVEALAAAFARAAGGGDGGGGKGKTSGGREERYYEEGEEGKFMAVTALTESRLKALEAQLNDGPFDVEGWLLLAMHRLPRVGSSATAVLNTIGAVSRGAKGPLGSSDDAALKPALRTLVRGLERADEGKAEALWVLYLTLFVFLPGKREDALGMAEHALENSPTSRRMWKLYRSMLRNPGHECSLPDEIAVYRRQMEALLLLLRTPARATATAASTTAPSPLPATNASVGNGNAEVAGEATLLKSRQEEAGAATSSGGVGQAAGGTTTAIDLARGVKGVEMIVYLVLERCSVLAEAGYPLQAAAEALEAVGGDKPLQGWDAPDENGRGASLLRAPSTQGNTKGNGGGRLPKGVADAMKRAPRDVRCLLWLTALHLLVTGVFPHHALALAEDDDHSSDDGKRCADLFQWPKECLSPGSPVGIRLSASAELREATKTVFMIALQDAGLLPGESGRGGGWAPPLRVRDALLPSTIEASAARVGGMAPDPSALEGPPLALALNWLGFCCRGGTGQAEGLGKVALACSRRFQLSRPDQPALLQHNLLEHDVCEARSLKDVYREISYAFDKNGAATAAMRERGETSSDRTGGDGRGRGGANDAAGVPPPPSGSRLQAVYAFLRYAEVRLEAATSNPRVADAPQAATTSGDGPAAGGTNPAAVAAGVAFDPDYLDTTRRVLRDALVGLWGAPNPPVRHPGRGKGTSDGWHLEEGGESLRGAVEGAKASLFRWADGGGRASVASAGAGSDDVAGTSAGKTRCFPAGSDGEAGASRELSTIVLALWVLGGSSAATGALDHLLSAESFSTMSPERRRLAWLQRIEAAVILSDHQVAAEDPMQGVREVTLRAITDHRMHHSHGHPSLAHVVTSTLEQPAVGGPSFAGAKPGNSASQGSSDPSSASSLFVYDVLTVYGTRFQEARGGVDWVVVAEAEPSTTPTSMRALLRWVSSIDEAAAAVAGSGQGGAASNMAEALRSHARPYAEKALERHPGDPGLAGAVAALEAATGRPDRAQRILEAALLARPLCSTLWEQRISLEAAFGTGSTERATATASAAASKEALLRLCCTSGCYRSGSGLDSRAVSSSPARSAQQARANGRILAAVSNPLSRQHTKSLSLRGMLGGQGTRPPALLPEVPLSAFLLAGLISLSLVNNGLTALPAAVSRLLLLRSLDASDNALTVLPTSLSALSGSLRVLRLKGNRLKSPLQAAPIGDLVSLRVLDLEDNELTQFPTNTALKLVELRMLKLAGNRFAPRAPTSLADSLPHLEELTLPDGAEANAGE